MTHPQQKAPFRGLFVLRFMCRRGAARRTFDETGTPRQ